MAFAGVDLDSAVESLSNAPGGQSESSAPSGSANAAMERPSSETAGRTEPSGESTRLEPNRSERKDFSKEDLERMLTGEQSASQASNDKFDKNFRFDFDLVLRDPTKLNDFRAIYPPEYVKVVEAALSRQGHGTAVENRNQQATNEAPWKNDPEYQKAIQTMQAFERMQAEARVQKIDTQLDNHFSKLSQKYPDADQNVINWYLQGLSAQKVDLMDKNGNLKVGILEKLFKADHDQRNAAYDKKYRAKIEAQKKTNSTSRDMGVGGNPASTGGKQFRTIKETTKAILEDMQNR